MRRSAVEKQQRRLAVAAVVEAVERESGASVCVPFHAATKLAESAERCAHGRVGAAALQGPMFVQRSCSERPSVPRGFADRMRIPLCKALIVMLALGVVGAGKALGRSEDPSAGGPDADALLRSAPLPADASKAIKARALVDAAIKMTNSEDAVRLLWQATEIEPTLDDPYVYLALYYNSRSDFEGVIKVYEKLIKYQPDNVSAYLNMGEAYMSQTPPKPGEAIRHYRKAYELDPKSSFAALRLGELMAQQGNRRDAVKFLKQASADAAKNPAIAAEAQRVLNQMGVM
jgi:tetratricopeptide (TPR) repeat protein